MPRRFPIWERLSSQETIWGGGPSTSKATSCVALGGCFAKREAPSALAYFRVVHSGNTIVSDYLANLGRKKKTSKAGNMCPMTPSISRSWVRFSSQ